MQFETRADRLIEFDTILARSRVDAQAGRVTPAEQVFDDLEAEINMLPET